MFGISGAIVIPIEPPAVQGLGAFGGFQFEVQDQGSHTLQDLDKVTQNLVVSTPGITNFVGAGGKPQPLKESEVERKLTAAGDGRNVLRRLVLKRALSRDAGG